GYGLAPEDAAGRAEREDGPPQAVRGLRHQRSDATRRRHEGRGADRRDQHGPDRADLRGRSFRVRRGRAQVAPGHFERTQGVRANPRSFHLTRPQSGIVEQPTGGPSASEGPPPPVAPPTPPPPPSQEPMVPAGQQGPVALNGPNCGGPPANVDRFGVATCSYCGTRFLVR